MKSRSVGKSAAFVFNVVLLVLFVFPLLLVLLNSFKARTDIIRNPLALPDEWLWSNYSEAFRTMDFSYAVLNSLTVTILGVALITVFSASLAYMLVRWKWKINNYLLMALVASMIIPFQALMIPFVTLYGNLHLLNSKWALIYFYLGFGMSMATFMYHGFVKNVPKELEEAALIDGAGKVRVFGGIVFPILKPISTTLAILNVLWIWNDFLLPSLALIKPEDRTLPLSTFYFFGKYTSNYGVAMAALVLSIIPVIVFYFAMQKQIIDGVVEGAVK
ncbi:MULTISPECIES: carbohydrate ABC transporter permease [Cohnella]|uniref:carbohydrate ABC transporter permease n=1 Tax=Cohnella TaxID=329857 RepID=UPI0009BA0B3D|nr:MULTISPECIES: carbohydrate ABC transporter permease [Cohnella]MBN2981946.1 carbohydrate ABC transporter permease [Cohnella algarum]